MIRQIPGGLGNQLQVLHGGGDRPRTAIAATRDVPLWQCKKLSDQDITTAIIKSPSGDKIFVASVYLDILNEGPNIFPSLLVKLVRKCKNSGHKLLLAIDSNAHSYLWGPDSNTRGEAVEDLMATYGLNLENKGFVPTFVARDTATHIDITLSLNCVTLDWRVSDEATLSDHSLIRFQIPMTPLGSQWAQNLKRADWDVFREHSEVSTDLPDTITVDWVEGEITNIQNLLVDSLEAACPKTRISTKIKKQSFWSPDLQGLKNGVWAARKLATRTGSQEDWDAWVSARREFRLKLRKAKKESWEKYVQGATEPRDLAKLFKSVQNHTNARLDLLGDCDEPKETLETLMETHFPGCNLEGVRSRTLPDPKCFATHSKQVFFYK